MRERDLKALEFDKVLSLVRELAVSEPGRQAVDTMRPSPELDEVRRRLHATAELADLLSRTGSLPIHEFADQRPLLLGAAQANAVLDGPSLIAIRDFVLIARQVRSFLRSRVTSRPNLGAIVKNLLAPKEIADAMLKALSDDGGLLDEASRELKRLRSRLRDERAELETRLLRSLNSPGMEPFVADFLVTVRNRRFVVPMKLNYTEGIEGIVQDRSVSGETLFVEPIWAVALNNRLMMLEREAEAEERRILARLTALVRGYAAELRITSNAMVAIDVLNALARFAGRFECSEPKIADQGIDLLGARHPLLVTSGREVVPIDLRIAAGQRGIVISGPNAGGKTVALKTLGLLTVMAQAGMLIPVREGSTVAAFRGVFAEIGDEQSIEASLSSFSARIANLSEILGALKEPSLVIVDEPGAGTDPAEGAALAIGLMSYLAERRSVLAIATHSTAVKLHAWSAPGWDAAAVDFDPERLEPLYRLKAHTIGQSYGLEIARRLGLPEEIIDSAKEAIGVAGVQMERALARLEQERKSLAEQTTKARDHERRLARLERENQAALRRVRERADRELQELRTKAESLIAGIRREGSQIIRRLGTQTRAREELHSLSKKTVRKIEKIAPSASSVTESSEPLRVGDQVELGDIRGEVLVVEPHRAVIGRGSLRIEVAPERLRRVHAAKGSVRKPPERRPPSFSLNAQDAASEDLNLVGTRTQEALQVLEAFLDRAYTTGHREVRIVHGIGSGALGKAVREYLASSHYCAAFRPAEPYAGGAGTTVAILNL